MRLTAQSSQKSPWYVKCLLWLQRKKYGRELHPSLVWARSPRVFVGFSALYGALNRKGSPIPKKLQALVSLYVSKIYQCRFCVDFNSFRLIEEGENLSKLKELSSYRASSLFTAKEKLTLEYAEAVTQKEREVTDELFARMREVFSEDEIVELTALIAFQSSSSQFNRALQIPAQGFSSG